MLEDVIKELREGIEKAIEALRRDLAKVRTGRANAAMLDGIRVDYYGVPTPIVQMATVSVPEPRLISVKPWEKNQVKAIEKAIRESDLGLNPQVDADLIRLPIPPLTEERRREMVKLTKKNGEDCKVAIRKHRRDANEMIDSLEKDGDVSGDEADRAKKKVDDVVAEGTKLVDTVIAGKEKDILDV
ncbi:ribosome recycling factor [Sorangium cellulosum]|uniref:Ribosome-recycling factor n=1 Tax=Sorangium cellulosum (strain So ce56) TaxID=448385 RepID=RRF_SORC5|nr:ribosome recycling factor [Sorangium cellulosum]A9GGK7.1 RecName: Full=Ribosome-recycling factor; Short=RRF; AltName: Full=Ribosome-releasing factor [Sorangium cellulosum So ce56]CAN96339.1 rrf [Sorangium cellulosum So ce56]